MIRNAQFDSQGIIVRLHPSDSGQTHVLTVQRLSGVNITDLWRSYTNPATALQAYRGMCFLFAAGRTVAEVIAFAAQVNPDTTEQPEIIPTPCETAA